MILKLCPFSQPNNQSCAIVWQFQSYNLAACILTSATNALHLANISLFRFTVPNFSYIILATRLLQSGTDTRKANQFPVGRWQNKYPKWQKIMFMQSRENYFGPNFPSCEVTRERNIKITLEWVHEYSSWQCMHYLISYIFPLSICYSQWLHIVSHD